MEVWQLVVLVAVGCVAGFVNVNAGGGSLLTMPVMVFMGMPGPVANGTNRIAIMAQNIAAVAGFARKGFSEFRVSLSLALCTLPGAAVGASLGVKLQGVWFNRVLAAVMVGVMIIMAAKRRKPRPADGETQTEPEPEGGASRRRFIVAHLLMVLLGFYGGFIQAGIGFLMMAVLHRVMRLDLVRVNMHKVFIIGVYGVVALGIFAMRGKVLWIPGLCLAVGNSAGGWFGSHFAVKRGEKAIRIVLYVALIAMAAKLLIPPAAWRWLMSVVGIGS